MSKITIESEHQIWRNEEGKIHREDGPAFIHPNETQAWYLNGFCHRLDGPARIWSDGRQSWYIEGKLYRLDGPAIIGSHGSQSWYINDIRVTHQVVAWIKENDFPDYTLWNDGHKIMFRLAFLEMHYE